MRSLALLGVLAAISTVCDFCEQSFSSAYNKRRHQERIHGANHTVVVCPTCAEPFNSFIDLRRHVQVLYKFPFFEYFIALTTHFCLRIHIASQKNFD